MKFLVALWFFHGITLLRYELNISIFWVMTWCSLVEIYQSFKNPAQTSLNFY